MWSGFIMSEEEINDKYYMLCEEFRLLKKDVSIDVFAEKISEVYGIPKDIAKCYSIISNNRFCQGSIHAVLGNVVRLLKVKMYCDAYELCRAYGEEETPENAAKYILNSN